MNIALAVSLLFAAIVLGQACSRSTFSSKENQNLKGNGDSYGGKTTRYALAQANQTCSELGADGQPLPVKVVFVYQNQTAELVREHCQDLDTPVAIPFGELSFSGQGATVLEWRGESYSPLVQNGDFSVVAQNCPAGMRPLAGITRVNLTAGSQDLANTSLWHNHAGIGVGLSGSMAGLYRYEISRNDPTNLDYWRRIHPAVEDLDPSSYYAYSFLAQSGTLNEVNFQVYRNGQGAISLIFNLTNGSVAQQEYTGFGAYSTAARRVAQGWFFTIYFNTPAGIADTVIGITPNGAAPRTPQVGDSIRATAIQLEKVSSFCGP